MELTTAHEWEYTGKIPKVRKKSKGISVLLAANINRSLVAP